ncbi:MAG: FapA family protein [Bacillota bacterium]
MDANFIIVEGKTLDEAIEQGLENLQTTREDVEIEVLQEGKTVMNMSIRKFRVKLIPKTRDISSNLENTVKFEAQESDAAENGHYEILNENGRRFLFITPARGNGIAVDAAEIMFALQQSSSDFFDKEEIQKRIQLKQVQKIDLDELAIKEIVDAKVLIEKSSDFMKAYLTITPPCGGKMVSVQNILDILKENNIVFGIDANVIAEMVEKSIYHRKTIVAVGKSPVNGEDGYIKYLFNIETKAKPTILEDGTVDLKNLNIIQNVSKGTILAERVLPKEGEDGVTVDGRVLKAKEGKTIQFKRGKNVIETSDGLNLVADADGQVKLIDDKVTVLQVFEVNGNVDNSIGNIKFAGKVLVRGHVIGGFTIESDGDVEVLGVVEGASIFAKGNIILHKGIQGAHHGQLISEQDIVSKYMENCHAKANGNIMADSIMHCTVECKGNIIVKGKKGLIVGGEVKAVNEISAKIIGSPMAAATKLEVGIDPDIKTRHDSLKNEIDAIMNNLERVNKAIDLLLKMAKVTELPQDKQEILRKSLETKKYLEEKLSYVTSEFANLKELMQSCFNGKIHVASIVYPGVRISIGNSVYYVKDQIQCTTFLRDEGEIRVTSYLG